MVDDEGGGGKWQVVKFRAIEIQSAIKITKQDSPAILYQLSLYSRRVIRNAFSLRDSNAN